jgi:hypothetical protein
MWGSKDLSLVAVLAALTSLIAASIGQMGFFITGLRGTNSIFTILFAIPISFALLMYQGRRWRFLLQMTIFTFIVTPTNYGGAPYDFFGKTYFIMAAFFIDVFSSSFYRTLKQKNQLKLYAVLCGFLFFTLEVTLSVALTIAFYTEQAAGLIFVFTLLVPFVIIEAIAGSYLGYKLYRRTSKDSEISQNTLLG